ncbi:MAG: helix-turn-helix domain-containing protein [Defluviitaleaceae bacterium]|nr:helix-turn-helix domain-containing protein [Defluviitaleaceae bacterium]
MPTLSDRLIQLKTEKKLMQKDIAKDNNISLRAYQYYERGERKPDSDIIERLADYFDVSIDYLVGRSDNPERK